MHYQSITEVPMDTRMKTSNPFSKPSPLLVWLREEILFSLVSRNHYLWGHTVDWQTNLVLFGNRNAGTHQISAQKR
jgi:hypothetical protein